MIVASMKGVIISSVLCTLISWMGCTPKTTAQKPPDSKQIPSRVGAVPVRNGGRYKIRFINEREGWLAQGRHVWRTVDGGASWLLVFSANQTATPINLASEDVAIGLEFVNSDIGIFQFGNKVYKTADGGRTWIALSNLPLQEPSGFLRCFRFLGDGKRGWMGGGTYRSISVEQAMVLPKEAVTYRDRTYAIEGILYFTENGGETWHRQPLPNTPGSIRSLYFYDERHGLALSSYYVFYTDDAGRKWRKANFSAKCIKANFSAKCIDDQQWRESADERYPISAFVSSDLGLVSFKDGYMAKSTDGGMSWCDFRQPGDLIFERSYEFLTSLHFVDSEHGFGLVAYRIYQTSDGGRTWTKHPLDVHIDAMAFVGGRLGWAVGPDGLFRISP